MNRHLHSIIFLAALSFAAVCCSGPKRGNVKYVMPEFGKVTDAKFEILGDDLYGLNVINEVAVHGKYIIVAAPDQEDGKLIHVYDKVTGEPLLHTLNTGRGPNEYLYSWNLYFDEPDGGIMRIFDRMKSKVIEFQLDSLVDYGFRAVRERRYESSKWNERIFMAGDLRIDINNVSHLRRGTCDDPRIEIVDREGSRVSAYDDYPYFENDEERWIVYNEARVSVSPDKNKMVVATPWGAIVELFDLAGGTVSLNAVKYMLPPEFKSGGNMYMYIGENMVDSFSDVYASDDKVYGAFGGEVKLESYFRLPAERRSGLFRNIVIFSWDGEGLEKIRTDYQIEQLCADTDGTIYAVLSDVDGRVYLGRLDR